MNFKEVFKHLQEGKAITIVGGGEYYPFFHGQYFLLKEQRVIIDMHGNDVTFNTLQASFDNDLQWEIYEPTKEELLFEIVKLKQDALLNSPSHLSSLGGLNALSGKYHIEKTR